MKKKILLSSIAGAAMLLAGCTGLVNKNSGASTFPSVQPQPSDDNSQSIPPVGPKAIYTNETIEVVGADVEVLDQDEINPIVAVVQGQEKATVYPLRPGHVTLKGAETVELDIYLKVYDIIQGNDYKMFGQSANDFRATEKAPFVIGQKNALKLDMQIQYRGFYYDEDSDSYETDVLLTSFEDGVAYLKDEDLPSIRVAFDDVDDAEELATINSDFSIVFSEITVGKNVEITVETDYGNLEYEFLINDGYNAYDNATFKELFQDASIEKINVLRSYMAELDDNQFYYNKSEERLVPFNTDSDADEEFWQGSVYYRSGNGNKDELLPVEINGNYMEINAQNLPLHVGFTDAGKSYTEIEEAAGGRKFEQAGFIDNQIDSKVVNPQESIFRLANYAAAPLTEDAPTLLTIRNLKMRGNSNRAAADADKPELDSGGFVGVAANYSKILLENVIMDYFVYAAQINSEGKLTVKDAILSDTWGPVLTSWNSKRIDVINSHLSKAGSALFWGINDYKGDNPTFDLVVDDKTILDNYLKTDSGWFKAYKLTGIANFTNLINSTISSQAQHTIFNNQNQINFIGLFQKRSDSKYSSYKTGTNLTIAGHTSVVDPTQYTDTANPRFNQWAQGIYNGSNNAMLSVVGQSTNHLTSDKQYREELSGMLTSMTLANERKYLLVQTGAITGSDPLGAVVEATYIPNLGN